MLKSAVRIILSVVLLTWLLMQVDLASVSAVLGRASLGWLLAAAAINATSLICAVWRWQSLLDGMGVQRKFWPLLRIILVGTFFSMFLPSSIGGDVMKMVLIAPEMEHREAAVSSVLMDRVMGMAVTIGAGMVAVIFLPAVWGNTTVIGALGGVTLIFCVGLAALFSRRLLDLIGWLMPGVIWRRVGGTLLRIHESLVGLRGRPDAMLTAAGVSLLRQLIISLSVLCAGQAFGLTAGLVAYFAMVPISMAITALPIAINGIGLQDNALILLLGTIGVGSAEALSLSLFIHATRMVTGMIGGLVFAAGRCPSAVPAAQSPKGSASERDPVQPVR
jgi:glycosyltransferase 2 family protein